MEGIESLGQHLVKCHQSLRIISLKEGVHQREAVFIIKDIEVAEHILIPDVSSAECNCLVEDGKRVTHCAVSLVCDHMERLVVDADTFA